MMKLLNDSSESALNPLYQTCEELAEAFRLRFGRGFYHAAALYRAFYRQLEIEKLREFAASKGLAEKVRASLNVRLPEIVRREVQENVTKLVFRLSDGFEIESVIIPTAHRTTLCISSQAGCRMGCRFCRTGRMGFHRNLLAHEIVAQVFTVKVLMGVQLRNLVFMGMGEPLDNLDEVLRAIQILEDQRGLNIAKRHMTVSTACPPGGIQKLADQHWPRLKLAVSLHAPDDGLRSLLMPVNRRFPLSEIKKALLCYPLARGNVFFIEYILIHRVNDQPHHARQLAGYLSGLTTRLNLIPFNAGPDLPYNAPTPEAVERFRDALAAEGLFVRVRSARGTGIGAACGQLGGNPLK